MLRDMKQRGLCPKALLLNASNPIMAQGAAFAGLALIDRFEVDVTQSITTGDRVDVDPVSGTVTVRSELVP
jgi:predicted aconitase with swiveling domain